MNKNLQELGDYDFGFTLMTEEQLDVVQEAKGKVVENREKISILNEEIEKQKTKALKVFAMVEPLLDNLASDPSKEYIYWPTRVEKIRVFKERLLEVINS